MSDQFFERIDGLIHGLQIGFAFFQFSPQHNLIIVFFALYYGIAIKNSIPFYISGYRKNLGFSPIYFRVFLVEYFDVLDRFVQIDLYGFEVTLQIRRHINLISDYGIVESFLRFIHHNHIKLFQRILIL